ncbi:MAG: YkgJ family cysteine cluster protein [Desulfuromonadaceae bacterium]
MLSLSGWLRYLRLRLQKRELIIRGHCRQCGNCCRRIQIQQGHRWLRSKGGFKKLVREHPEYSRFNIIGRDTHGLLLFDCTWLQDDNTCARHGERLDICRNFPAKAIFFCGGQLPHTCGYKVEEVKPFARILQDKMEKRR